METKGKILIGIFVIIGVILISGCVQQTTVPSKICSDTSTYYIFQEDAGYKDVYNDLTVPEKSFTGILTYESCAEFTTLQRCTPYKLDGVSVYTGSESLEKYIGYKVEISGKKHSFELEGSNIEEIWPWKISCAPK